MGLTNGQEQAMEMVGRLLKVEHPEFAILSGYAGTGKSFLIKKITEAYGPPVVITPTGKAALRVREMSGLPASTIHRWLYDVSESQETGELVCKRKDVAALAIPHNDLIIVDEASMVSESVWNDIWTAIRNTCAKILLVGDPFQLPPVTKLKDTPFTVFKLETDFRVSLTEVCRQALDSPIIRTSMALRKNEMDAMDAMEELGSIDYTDVPKTFAEIQRSKAVICHRNVTRQELNRDVRALLGRGPEIEPGEPLLVLANNYRIDRFNGEVLEFGGWQEAPGSSIAVRDRWKNISGNISYGVAQIENDQAILSPEEVWGKTFGMGEKVLARAGRSYIKKTFDLGEESPSHLNANLGYALTCHKSQGSEWDEVIVIIEPSLRMPYSYEWRRWVYTALTRAKESVKVANL